MGVAKWAVGMPVVPELLIIMLDLASYRVRRDYYFGDLNDYKMWTSACAVVKFRRTPDAFLWNFLIVLAGKLK